MIGCGNIYGMHTDVLRNIEQVTVAAVADTKPERAQAAAREHECRHYGDYREILARDDIDAVHILTPHDTHAQIAIEALNAGKYVLCEKPMAIHPDDARAMIAADEKAGGRHLCVVFQNRYNRAAAALKEMTQRGRYGRLIALRGNVMWKRTQDYYSDDWHGTQAHEGGGVMINQAIHTLDMVQWLGGGASAIRGMADTLRIQGIEVEDSAQAFIRMKNGATAVFCASLAYEADAPVEVEMRFEKATLLMRGDTLYQWEENQLELICGGGATGPHKDYWGQGHKAQIADFYRCIREGLPFAIDGAQGIEAVKLVQGLYLSSKTGEDAAL